MSNTDKKLPLVVIFGRTNVGKSTLFNCLIEKQKALVSDTEGTTRDSNIGLVTWRGVDIKLVDTGGIMDLKFLTGKKIKTDDIEAQVQLQARDYLKRAFLILFLVDTRDGLLPPDKQLVTLLKKIIPDTKKIILVANKADNPRLRREAAEFNKLALGEPALISASSGSGTGDLLDNIVEKITRTASSTSRKLSSTVGDGEEDEISVAIIGQPNVGKSSLINALIDEKRLIVSPVAHTTREPQDARIKFNNRIIKFIDTAGISKRGQKSAKKIKFKNTLEKFSITKSLGALRRADLALLILDINDEITHQDSKLVEEIFKKKKNLIIIANKWDLIEDRNTKHYTQHIYSHFPFAWWAPIQFTSALTGEKVKKIFDLILEISEQRKIQIKDNALSKFLNKIVKRHKPTKGKGTKHPHIFELKQLKTNPPLFSVRIGAKDSLSFSYVRFIENRLRDKWGFLGTPITIKIEKNKFVHGKHETR